MRKKFLGLALLAISLTALPSVAAGGNKDPGKAGRREVVTAGFSFAIGAAPAWVVPVKEESGAALPKSSMHYVLIDGQTRIDGGTSVAYNRVIRQVDDSEGLSPAAQVQIEFDPAYQTLVLHKIEIVRDGRHINKLDRKKIQLLQRETQLEARMYDGRVTASVVLDDVRVGDRVEYSYSIRGANPVFDGMAVGEEWLGSDKGPTAVAQFRLLAPESRVIATRAGAGIAVSSTTQRGMRDTRFRRVAAPQLQYEVQTPPAAMLDDAVQFSEFRDWPAVRDWGARLYVTPAATSGALQDRIDAIRREAGTPEERVLRALKLVQTEVRYFGVEMGASSHHPSAPRAVLERRAGDCKDKVALLVALLKGLDIKAEPVLVSTVYRGDVAGLLPSPLAFDHVIARVELGGKAYWLDGTRSRQTGALAQRQSTGLGKGLVLDTAVPGLADLPGAASEERIAVNDVFHIAKMADAPTLESRITYRGDMAEVLRAMAATMPREKLESDLAADYARIYPSLRAAVPMRIEEHDGENALTVVQQFVIPDFWRFPEQRMLNGEVGLWNIATMVQMPNTPTRRLAFRVPFPGVYRHTVTVEFPEALYRAPDTKRVNEHDAHFDYRLVYEVMPDRAKTSAELDLTGDRVAAADWRSFNEALAKVRSQTVVTLNVPAMSLADSDKLAAQVKTLIESMRRGDRNFRVVTPVQVDARVHLAVLSAQLDAGFLNPRLRAKALAQRGVYRDHLGLAAEAVADYDEAMRLDPDNPETIGGAAVNAFLRGDIARARELSQKVLKLAPSYTEARNTLGFADYFSADYPAAAEEWKALLNDQEARARGYPAIWLYMTTRRAGGDGVGAVQPFLSAQSATQWPNQVLQWLTGAGSYEQALKAASETKNDPSRLCELYFYAGEKYLLDGDRAKAREYFRKSVDTGVTEFNEYGMAQRELVKLGS